MPTTTNGAGPAEGLQGGDKIVTEFSPEFDLDALFREADQVALSSSRLSTATGVTKLVSKDILQPVTTSLPKFLNETDE